MTPVLAVERKACRQRTAGNRPGVGQSPAAGRKCGRVRDVHACRPASDVVVIVSGADCTVKVVLPVMPLNVAEMVVLPELIPVARPALVMVAMPVFDDVHVAWLVMFCVLPSE